MTDTNGFKIEKGISLRDRKGGPGRKEKYPLSLMEVGDSFAISSEISRLVTAAASQAGKRHKRKFVVRKTTDGHRCWRVA